MNFWPKLWCFGGFNTLWSKCCIPHLPLQSKFRFGSHLLFWWARGWVSTAGVWFSRPLRGEEGWVASAEQTCSRPGEEHSTWSSFPAMCSIGFTIPGVIGLLGGRVILCFTLKINVVKCNWHDPLISECSSAYLHTWNCVNMASLLSLLNYKCVCVFACLPLYLCMCLFVYMIVYF